MIFEGVLDVFFALVNGLISLFPASSLPDVALVLGSLVTPLEYACYYFGADTLAYVVGNVIFWSTIQISWAVIEWLYHKIPGIT